MDSIGDMLAKRPTPQEPPELVYIREFVQQKYNITPKLSLSDQYIIITVPHASVASLLRYDEPELALKSNTNKKLRIRIGS